MTDPTHDAIVVGAGLAGLAAVAEIARLGRAAALVDDGYLGGLVANVGHIEGGPEHAGKSGADLVDSYLGAALEAGADYRIGAAAAALRDGALWRLPDLELAAPCMVLATGAELRRLDVPGEAALTGKGVSQCAFCDGGLYREKAVVVVGGGDAAFQEALHLADICGEVTMLLRGAAPRARAAFVDRAQERDNLRVRTGVEVREIVGDAAGVTGVRIFDRTSGAEERLPALAVFPFVGLAPRTALAPAAAARDAAGALVVDAGMGTSAAGLYAVGAARAGHGGAIADAMRDAAAVAAAIAG